MSAALLPWLVTLATAATPAADDSGRLDAVVDRILARHPALVARAAAADASDLQAAQARAAWNPQLSLDAWYRYSQPLPELSIDTGLTLPGQTAPIRIDRELGSPHQAGAQLNVAWRALDFGARDALARAARAQADAARADGAAQAAELAYAARATYLAALLYDALADAADRALLTAKSARDLAERARAAGLGAAVHVAAQDSRAADLEARRDDARASADQARQNLRLLLGLPAGAPLDLTDDLATLAAAPAAPAPAPWPAARGVVPLRAAPLTPALAAPGPPDAHPTLARLAALDRALAAQSDATSAARWPTLDLFARAGYQYPVTFVEDEAGPFAIAGLSLAWKLWDGGLTGLREDELAARRRELDASSAAAREDLATRALDAATRAGAAHAAIIAAGHRVAAAEVYLTVAQAGLTGGTATALDLQKAEVALDEARIALVKARFDAALAHAQALRAAGQVHAPSSAPPAPPEVQP